MRLTDHVCLVALGLQQLSQRCLVRRQPRRGPAAEDALPAAPRRGEAVADRQAPGLAHRQTVNFSTMVQLRISTAVFVL